MKLDIGSDEEYKYSQFPYHHALFKILRGELEAADVEVLICRQDLGVRYIPAEERDVEQRKMTQEAADILPLINHAVKVSPWIDDEQTEEWVNKLSSGDPEAALCLLVPLLVNLRHLRPPIYTLRLEEVVERIAKASALPTTNQARALGKLVLVEFWNENYEIGVRLESAASYAALPSVRRLVMEFVRSRAAKGEFDGWPADLPLSRASELYFDRSSVVAADARSFAQGFVGPCKMFQTWNLLPGEPPEEMPDVEWDYLELGAGGMRVEWRDARSGELYAGIERGSRQEIMELRAEGAHDRRRYWRSGKATEFSDEMNALVNFDHRLRDWRDVQS